MQSGCFFPECLRRTELETQQLDDIEATMWDLFRFHMICGTDTTNGASQAVSN